MKLMARKHWQVRQSDGVVRASGLSTPILIKENAEKKDVEKWAKANAEYPDMVKETHGTISFRTNKEGKYASWGRITLSLE